MAYITIPELPAGVTLTGLEQFESVQGGGSVKLSAAQIKLFTSSVPTFVVNDANNAGVSNVVTLTHTTSGVPAVGIGGSLTLSAETGLLGVVTEQVKLVAVSTSITAAAEAADFVVRNMVAGTVAEVARITSTNRLGIGTAAPACAIDTLTDDANNNSVVQVFNATHSTSGSPSVGIGTRLALSTETSAALIKVGGAIDSVVTANGVGVESFGLAVNVMDSGTLTEAARFMGTKRLGVGTLTPTATIEAAIEDANQSSNSVVGRFTHTTSGTPAVGIGTSIELLTEVQSNTTKIGGIIAAISTSVAPGIEEFDLAFGSLQRGSENQETMRLQSATAFHNARVGINTSTPQSTLQVLTSDIVTNVESSALRLSHITANVPVAGFGTNIEFELETTAGVNKVGSTISSVIQTTTFGLEDIYLSLQSMNAGVSAERLRIGTTVAASVDLTTTGNLIATTGRVGAGVAAPTAFVDVAAGTATVPQIKLAAGTLLTIPVAGSLERDVSTAYFTPAGTARGLIVTQSMFQLGADRALANVITAQSMFGVSTALAANTRYEYELDIVFNNTAVSAKAIQYALAGTATVTQHEYNVMSFFAAAFTTPTAQTMMYNRTAVPGTLVSITPASAAIAGYFVMRMKGSFDVSVAGTVDFQMAFTVAPTVGTALAASHIILWPVGNITGNTSVGNWA